MRVLTPVSTGGGTARHAPAGRRAKIARIAMIALLASPFVQATALHGQTLREALANAYKNNPRLDAERARLRATDEEVARANSGWRPNVSGSADIGRQTVHVTPKSTADGSSSPWGYSVSVTQPVFSGFRTINAVREAEALVRAGRENLRLVEAQVLLEAATAYVDVVRDGALVRLRENHVSVLSKDLAATEARRNVREVTRTDVAQAMARRAKSLSALDLARANLKSSRALFEKATGVAAGRLVQPQPLLSLLPRTLEDALRIGEAESPNVVSALYREEAARYSVERIWGELLPEVRLEASYAHRMNPGASVDEQDVASVTGRVNIPLYAGGETHARIRAAKHTHVSRLQEVEQARNEVMALVTQAWSRFQAARAQLKSDKAQVDAFRIALEGTREEEKVGQRTVLDVLNAEQELLDAEVQLVATRRDVVVAAFQLLAVIGRLSAAQLHLLEEVYDPDAHYSEVRRKWFGIDITHADGRRETVEATDLTGPGWDYDD